jgi:hypothetical protein
MKVNCKQIDNATVKSKENLLACLIATAYANIHPMSGKQDRLLSHLKSCQKVNMQTRNQAIVDLQHIKKTYHQLKGNLVFLTVQL